jgi:hypothetical protein
MAAQYVAIGFGAGLLFAVIAFFIGKVKGAYDTEEILSADWRRDRTKLLNRIAELEAREEDYR